MIELPTEGLIVYLFKHPTSGDYYLHTEEPLSHASMKEAEVTYFLRPSVDHSFETFHRLEISRLVSAGDRHVESVRYWQDVEEVDQAGGRTRVGHLNYTELNAEVDNPELEFGFKPVEEEDSW